MEPERKIEKLLRAFAKKRREQAGDAVELRSATRERLHREISRRSPGKSGGGFFAVFFAGFRPRLAFAVCFMAIAAIGAWLVSPALRHSKPDTLASLNRRRADISPAEQPAPMVAPPAVVAPSPVSRDEDKTVIVEKRTAFAGGVAKQPNGTIDNRRAIVSDNEMPAPAVALENSVAQTNSLGGINMASAPPLNQEMLADKTSAAPADLFAGARALNKDSIDGAQIPSASQMNTNSTLDALTLAAAEPEPQRKLQLAGTLPATPRNGVVFDDIVQSEAAKKNAFASQQFRSVEVSSTPFAKQTLSVRSPVLASFRVEQNGGEMRIVDADGSIYTGTVQVVEAERTPLANFSATLRNAPEPTSAAAAKARPQMPAVQNYFFRVTGTNRNLRQNVVFSGNLIPLTNAGALAGSAAGQRMKAETFAPTLLLNARITGKAVIGNQKEIKVDARPAPEELKTTH